MTDFLIEPELFPITKNTWGLNNDHLNLKEFSGKFISINTHKKFNSIQNLQSVENLIIYFSLYELNFIGDCTEWVKNTLNFIYKKNLLPNLKNVYLLYHSVSINLEGTYLNYNVKKVYCNILLLRSSLTSLKTPAIKTQSWNCSNKKAIFLLGDGGRISRLPVLYEFYVNNSLDLLDYSFDCTYPFLNNTEEFFAKGQTNSVLQAMSSAFEIDYNNLKEHVIKLQNKLSDDEFFQLYYTELGPFDTTAYTFPKSWGTSLITIITETSFNNDWLSKNIFFTEKMYKPILTKKPFITCSNQDYLYETLENNGFKTFLEYTDYPGKLTENLYLDHKHLKLYTSTTYNRTISFIKNAEKYQKQITNDIEHNYELYEKLCDQHWQALFNDCPPLTHLDRDTICQIFKMGAPVKFVISIIDKICETAFIDKLKAKITKNS